MTIWAAAPRAEAGVMILWLDVAEENEVATEDVDTPAMEQVKDVFECPLPPAIEDEGCYELETFAIAPAAEVEVAVEEAVERIENKGTADDERTASEFDFPLPPPIPAQSLETEDAGFDGIVEADIFETVAPEQPAGDADSEDLAAVGETADANAGEAVELEQLSTIERFNQCREIMESAELEPAAIETDAFAAGEVESAAPSIDEVTRQVIEQSIHSLSRYAAALRQRVADFVADTAAQTDAASVVADAESTDEVEGDSSSDPRDVIYNAQEAEVSDSYANDAGTYEYGEYDYDYDYGYEYYSDGYSYEDEYEREYDEAEGTAESDVDDTVNDESEIDAEMATDQPVTAEDSVQAEDAVQSDEVSCPYADEYESGCPYADEYESGCPYTDEYDEESVDAEESDDSTDEESSYDPEDDYSYDADDYEYYGDEYYGDEYYGDEFYGDEYDATYDEASGAEVVAEGQEEADSSAVEIEPTSEFETGTAADAFDASSENESTSEDDAAFDYESHYDYDYDYGYEYEFDAEYAD